MKKKKVKEIGITALYERLSRDDDGDGDSNSIVHQKQMLEAYAKEHGFVNLRHYTDDGWSGASFDRPAWNELVAGVKAEEITTVFVKDLSRVGRDHLQVGFFTDILFREKEVHFIAIGNGIDSNDQQSSEFAPFLNIMNEWYIRDCSRKITSVLRARGMSGKHTSNHCIYGYKKDPNDKDHWIIDEEAAEVVRRIYRMAIEGKGPYEIARILATEKVERPSYYLAQRGMGNHQSNYNAADPYTWRGGTVADILSKQEYMGHTVNFRTYKESYKDKRVKMTPKEDLVIFENTQEAIIDKETWERVQTLRKTIRRTDSIGKANPLTGLMFCADCGAKMYNHRGKAGNARDWAGRPNGKKRPDRDEYNCSRYDLGNQHYDKYCTTHLIRTAVVNELLLEAIKGVCDYALSSEAEFMAQVCSASEARQEKAARAIRQRKQRNEKRTDELTRLIRKLYEDNVSGRLSDTLFEQMLRDFEAELSDLTEIVSQDQQELERISRETINAEKFLSLVRKYTDFSELTPAMINEFVEKILVHQAQGKGASRIQEIEIFFNFVGQVDIPHKEVELTEEEKAALAEQDRRRAKKAEYNRRYMEKKRRQWKEQQEQEQAEEKGRKSKKNVTALATEPDEDAKRRLGAFVASTYARLNQIEDAFRVMKSNLGLRPMFVRNSIHVQGHVGICVLALLLVRLLQDKLKKAGVQMSIDEISRSLRTASTAVLRSGDSLCFQHVGEIVNPRRRNPSLSTDELLTLIREEKQKANGIWTIMQACGLKPLPRATNRHELARCLGTRFGSDQEALSPIVLEQL